MANKIGDLAVYVVDEQGQTHWLLPGDIVPGWATGLVGAHALAGAGHSDTHTPTVQPSGEPSADTPSAPHVPAAPAPAHSGDSPPPQAGAGSSRDHWASYAAANGVTVGAEWKRDRIIDACRQGGVRVE